MSDFSIGMLCATALTVATLFFRWLDRRMGWNATNARKLVVAWRKEGRDKASLFTLVTLVLGVVVVMSIPRLVTITLLMRGHVVAATAFLLTGLAWSAGSLVLGATSIKDDLDDAFDDKPEAR